MVFRLPSCLGTRGFYGLALLTAVCWLSTSGIALAQNDLMNRVQGHLAAGEFGPALDLIRNEPDPQMKSQMLQLVSNAQLDAGEFDSALFSIRQMNDPALQQETGKERIDAKNLAGGGLFPDFTELIFLIQTTIDGAVWDDTQQGLGAGSGNTGPTDGTINGHISGVSVDPNGLMHNLSQTEVNGRLQALGMRARQAALNDDMSQPSSFRLVSLTRLEQAVAEQIASGRPVVTSMKHLAGLTKVEYVFVFPESGEIVIGGPAEPWAYTNQGLAVGQSSGRPTLQLDDLVTVLRTFSNAGDGMFNCLIVPRQEGLKAIKEYVDASNNAGPLAPGQVKNWTGELQNRLGLQDVVVNGVPVDSRVARVIVEADYRMKLIGVGKLSPVRSIPSFFDLLAQTREQNLSSVDALRWWLTMKYEAVLHSPEREVFEIRGSSVKCLSENEFITAQGERVGTEKAEKTNRLFAEKFTENYAELASADSVFADLQNVFDLSLVAALIRSEGMDARANWDHGVFAPHGEYQTEKFAAPKTVMTVVNHRVYNGRNIVVQVAGGVKGDLLSVTRNTDIRGAKPELSQLETRAAAPELPAGRWWWDAR